MFSKILGLTNFWKYLSIVSLVISALMMSGLYITSCQQKKVVAEHVEQINKQVQDIKDLNREVQQITINQKMFKDAVESYNAKTAENAKKLESEQHRISQYTGRGTVLEKKPRLVEIKEQAALDKMFKELQEP